MRLKIMVGVFDKNTSIFLQDLTFGNVFNRMGHNKKKNEN